MRCWIFRLILNRQGTAAVEMALFAPLLVIMVIGLMEIGMGVYQYLQVQAAAEAGALYVVNNGSASLSAIETAVTDATSTADITATPVPLLFCGCPVVARIVSQGPDCATPCADKTAPGYYVTVSASITRTSLISSAFLSLPLPDEFTATSTIRTK